MPTDEAQNFLGAICFVLITQCSAHKFQFGSNNVQKASMHTFQTRLLPRLGPKIKKGNEADNSR